MKVEINEKGKTKEKEFPKLMIGKCGMVIIAINSDDEGFINGVVIQDKHNTCYDLGYSSIEWDPDYFQDFEGSITLSND